MNRSLDTTLDFECTLKGFEGYRLAGHITVNYENLEAVNTVEHPGTIVPGAA